MESRSHLKPFLPVGASNTEVGASKGFAFHLVLTDILYRGSMSSRLCEKPAYRLHAEYRRLPLPDEINVGGVVRAETHIPSAGKPPGLHTEEADPKRV